MSAAQRDLEVLAGEYVLGVLGEREAEAFEGRIEEDGLVRAAVGQARDRFLELDLTAAAAPAPPALWEKIAKRLDEPKPSAKVIAMPGGKGPRAGGFWRGFGAASLAASLVLAIAAVPVWMRLSSPPGPGPSVVVVLVDAQAKPGAIIEAYGDDTVRVVPLENFTVPPGRVIQLWTLPDTQTGPVSLGLLSDLHELRLRGPSLPKPKPDQLYEFTLEPSGGSPTGRPTGPVLVKGLAKTPI